MIKNITQVKHLDIIIKDDIPMMGDCILIDQEDDKKIQRPIVLELSSIPEFIKELQNFLNRNS